MRKIVLILTVILVIAIGLMGCGGKGDDGKDATSSNESAPVTNNSPETDDSAKDSESDKSSDSNKSNVEFSNSAKIPDAYPQDLFPTIEGSKIEQIITNDANKGVTLVFSTGKSRDEVISFYEEVLKEADVQVLSSGEDYLLVAEKNGYVLTLSISEFGGDRMVMLDARPSL